MRQEIELSILLFILLAFLVAGCGISNSNSVRTYNDYGIKCAKMGLWNEATMHWKHLIEMDPDNAQVHNNLGVAYESRGKFDAAMAEYRMAIELDPDNKTYMRNYVKFKRNYERARKRDEIRKSRPEFQGQTVGTEGAQHET